ncbi:prepilin-type N-terminal cleavage/methylation domain-containing protein [Candidatus Saccharibacteria bacterium]|nr:MAG: prepilin-type N-terminal cleavage/methylation domain-containing protein [Candidatus Saccharibacteria bacterium]
MKYGARRGFTLVEVSVVIALLSVLASVTVVSFSQAQRQARDKSREANAQIIAGALEKYYVANGEYPGCNRISLDAATVTSQYLIGVDKSVLRMPQDTAPDDNSITCGEATLATNDIYAYVGETSSTCSTGTSCLEFTLKWRQEADNQTRSISSEHKAVIASSGAITVSASPTGTTTGAASWTSIPNALSYTLQISTNATFTAPTSSTYTTTNGTFTGLSQGTTYWVRARANSASSTGDWSNTATLTTNAIVAPTISVSAQSATQVGISWGTVAGASGYNLQYSANNTTWSTLVNSTATNSYTHTGLNQGVRLYYRVQAIVASVPGNWAVANVVTPINAPAAFTTTLSKPSWNWWTIGADQAICPAGTTRSWDWYYYSNIRGSQFWASGTAYNFVGFNAMWDESVSVNAFARCYTAETTSGFTQGSPNQAFSMPSTYTYIETGSPYQPLWRSTHWVAWCPSYTTSWNFHVWTSPAVGIDFWTTVNDGWYDKENIAWGDGNSWLQSHCYGPWGDLVIERSASYGNGCMPPNPVAICYSRSPY